MIQKYIFCVWGRSGPLTQIKFSVYQWLDNMLVYDKLKLTKSRITLGLYDTVFCTIYVVLS